MQRFAFILFAFVFCTQIADVYAKDGADFAKLRLTSGSEVVVRLDRLLSVNGFDLPTAC